jgi:hypothetical protein
VTVSDTNTSAALQSMGKGLTDTAGLEPPTYVSSLIAAINDGAKTAQAGALVFLLLATAFSSSDEDLLRGKTVTILQIGASLPITFSFVIAPLVFVFVISTRWRVLICWRGTSFFPKRQPETKVDRIVAHDSRNASDPTDEAAIRYVRELDRSVRIDVEGHLVAKRRSEQCSFLIRASF